MTIGLDLGGTTFNAACGGDAGRILASREYETRQHESPDLLLPRLANAILEVHGDLDEARRGEVGAAGIGVPGPVKPRSAPTSRARSSRWNWSQDNPSSCTDMPFCARRKVSSWIFSSRAGLELACSPAKVLSCKS